jgi:hypothetical protein
MSLAEYQRGVLRTSLGLAPAQDEFAALGDPERFRLYRRMVRGRLREMAGVAFKQSLAASGAALFDACFERYLEREPPRSPFIRDVIAAFGPFARAQLGTSAERPAYLADLLRFEEAKWRVAYAPVQMPKPGEDGVRELDFEGWPLLNPTLVLLALEHAVHTLPETPPVPGPLSLLLYRPPGRDDVRWYAADPLLAAIVTRVLDARGSAPGSLAELVRTAAAELALALDGKLLEDLASALTLAISRGVLIGVR